MSPAARATDVSITRRFEVFRATSAPLVACLDRVEEAAFSVQGYLREIFRPVTEGTGLVQVGTRHLSTAVFLPREPVQFYQLGGQNPLGDQGLDAEKEQIA